MFFSKSIVARFFSRKYNRVHKARTKKQHFLLDHGSPIGESLESRLVLTCSLTFFDTSTGFLSIHGTPANDIVRVTELQDEITVLHGSNTPCAFPLAQVTRISFNGGAGDDVFENTTGIDIVVDGGPGDDVLTGGSGNDWIVGGDGNDILRGGGGDDVLKGQAGSDALFGGDGNDNLDGGDGADFLDGGNGNDVLTGGNDNDELRGGAGDDFLDGGAGNDLIFGDDGDDTMNGGDGDDSLYGGLGNDALNGNGGNDFIHGDDGNDVLSGGDGNDILRGGDGNDILFGNAGMDQLFGDNGDDQLFGGDGNDALHGGTGRDLLYGDAGDDWLWGGDGDDELRGGLGHDLLVGEAGNDILHGDEGNDLLLGGMGADSLYGHDGNDILVGGSGIDFLNGMNGEDILIGGLTSFGDDVSTIEMQDWFTIWANWSNTNLPYSARITTMSATTNPLALIPGSSVLDDFVSDHLIGAADLDWFFLIGGNGVQTPNSSPLATLATLDSYDALLNETIHTNAINNVLYPSLITDGTGDNALPIRLLLYFSNVVTLPAGVIRVNMTGETFPIEIPAGKTLQGQPDGSTSLRFHTSAPMHNPRGIRMFSDTVLQDLSISQIGHGTTGSSVLVYAQYVNNVTVRKNKVLGPSLARQSSTANPSNPFYVRDSSNILIEDSEFAGAQGHFGAELLNVANSQIVRSKFHTNGWDGLKIHGTVSTPLNLEVSESKFYNNGRTVPDTGANANGNGIDLYGRGIIVRDSVAHGNYGTGFQVKPGNGHYASDITFIRSESHHQKSVNGSGYHGFGVWNGEFSGAIHNIRFEDSYSHHNDGSGFWIGQNATNVSIINSVADFNLGSGLRVTTPSSVTQANFTGTGNGAGLVVVVGAVVPIDVNGDGVIDGADASILFSLWQSSGIADLNRDGIVDGADLATLFAYWTGDSAATTSQTHPTDLQAKRKPLL